MAVDTTAVRRPRRLSRASAPTIALTLGLSLATAGCGGSSQRPATVTAPTPAPGSGAQFSAAGVPFTFSYPSTFQPVSSQQAHSHGLLGVVGIDRVDLLDVRQVATQGMSLGQIEQVASRTLSGQVRVSVAGHSRERHGTLDTVRYTVKSSGGALTSLLYFFANSGRTWELECQWSASHRLAVVSACDQALATLH